MAVYGSWAARASGARNVITMHGGRYYAEQWRRKLALRAAIALTGSTIAVSETRCVTQIAKRTVLSDNALSVLVPILEEVAHWTQPQIRRFFESQGFLVQEWARMRTDFLTLRSTSAAPAVAAEAQ